MIKIEQLLPLLKKGWVAMDEDKDWYWYNEKPIIPEEENMWYVQGSEWYNLGNVYMLKDIAPVEDWTKSLMKCGEEPL